MPKISGPAKELRKAVCSIKPAADSEAPQSRAVIACGSLDCNTINSQLCFVDSPLNRIETTSLKGIFTEPMNRLSSSSNAIATDIKITAVFTFLRSPFFDYTNLN